LALGMVAQILSNTKERGERLGMLLLDRTLESQEQRFRLIARTYEWDLMEEAAHVMERDRTGLLIPLQRWMPLMRSRFAITDIALANEHGDERMLQHVDSLWRFVHTVRGVDGVISRDAQWPINRSTMPPLDSCAPQADPRRSNWFSRALEKRQEEPVWSESERPQGENTLHLSVMVRGGLEQEEFRVLRFSIDADAMLSGFSQLSPHVSTIVLDSKWRPLSLIDSSQLGRAWHTVLQERQRDQFTTTFRNSTEDLH